MAAPLQSLCDDLNTITQWLACDPPLKKQVQDARAVILLGNQVIATFDQACELAKHHPSKPLVFSGGIGHATPALYENFAALPHYAPYIAPGMSEAAMYAAIAEHAWHIPPERLLLETGSENAGGNARYSLQIVRDAGIAEGSVLLIQDPLMLRRSVLTWQREAELAGLALQPVPATSFVPQVEAGPEGVPQIPASQRAGSWPFQRFLGLALGEIVRLRDDQHGYGPRGRDFFAHIDLPDQVEDAWQRVNASPLSQLARR